MQEITPEDIGVLYGTQLSGAGPDGPWRWDGQRLLTATEYNDLKYLYGIFPDPRIIEALAEVFHMTADEYRKWIDRASEQARTDYYRAHGEAPWLSIDRKEKDDWDTYVERFIEKHQLPEPLVKRANDILKRAKKLRNYYRRKHVSEKRAAERKGNEAKLARYQAIEQRIFDRVLVRNLKRLLPRKKRK